VDGYGFSMHWLLLHIIQEHDLKKQKMYRRSQQHEVLLHIFQVETKHTILERIIYTYVNIHCY
jgi:hypothetical protein